MVAFQLMLENLDFLNAQKFSYNAWMKSSRLEVNASFSTIIIMEHLIICIHMVVKWLYLLSPGKSLVTVATRYCELNIYRILKGNRFRNYFKRVPLVLMFTSAHPLYAPQAWIPAEFCTRLYWAYCHVRLICIFKMWKYIFITKILV